MSPASANLVFEAANFVLLFLGLGYVLFRPVRRALDAERERLKTQQAEFERWQHEAQAAEARANELRASAERDASTERTRLLEVARHEADALLEAARRQRQAEHAALATELDAQRAANATRAADGVARIAAASVRSLLDSLDGPALDLALLRAACVQLAALPELTRHSARVESARPLNTEAATLLTATLGTACVPRIVPALGAGVRITTDSGQIDATARALSLQAARAIEAANTQPVAAEREQAAPHA